MSKSMREDEGCCVDSGGLASHPNGHGHGEWGDIFCLAGWSMES